MTDEQVGNNSMFTMTPGSAVAGQLQNILTQKRLEARQAMLDSLNQKNVESQIQDRDQQAQTNAMYRQSLADDHASRETDRMAQEVQRRAGVFAPGQEMGPGPDLDFFHKNAPNLLTPATPEIPQFDYEGQPSIPASPERFRGLPAQIESKRKTDAQLKAAEVMRTPEYQKMSKPQQAYWYEQATLHEPSAAMFAEDKENQSVPIFVNGKPTGEWGPPNALHFNVPHDPQQPAPERYEVADDKGNVTIYSVDRNNKATPVEFGSGLRVLGKAGVVHPPPVPKGPDDRLKIAFAAAKKDWMQHPSDATREGTLKQTAAYLINSFPASDAVRQQVQNAYNNPGYRKLTLDQFKNTIDPSSNEKNANDAIRLWQLLVQE